MRIIDLLREWIAWYSPSARRTRLSQLMIRIEILTAALDRNSDLRERQPVATTADSAVTTTTDWNAP